MDGLTTRAICAASRAPRVPRAASRAPSGGQRPTCIPVPGSVGLQDPAGLPADVEQVLAAACEAR